MVLCTRERERGGREGKKIERQRETGRVRKKGRERRERKERERREEREERGERKEGMKANERWERVGMEEGSE